MTASLYHGSLSSSPPPGQPIRHTNVQTPYRNRAENGLVFASFSRGTFSLPEDIMAGKQLTRAPIPAGDGSKPAEARGVTREQLIELLNEDLAREYQAIIAYVVYSQ